MRSHRPAPVVPSGNRRGHLFACEGLPSSSDRGSANSVHVHAWLLPRPAVWFDWCDPFLIGVSEGLPVTHAAARANIDSDRPYQFRQQSTPFAERWKAAESIGRDLKVSRLDSSLFVRLLDGVDEPVFGKGGQVGTRRRYDNRTALRYLEREDRNATGAGEAAEDLARRIALAKKRMRQSVSGPPDPAPPPAGESNDAT